MALCAVGPAQTFADLYSFTSANSSQRPAASLAQGRNGKLYGTTVGDLTYGSVFSITSRGSFAELYAFDYTNGENPTAGLTLATDGNFYGAALGGGSAKVGTLFKVSPSGVITSLHSFSGGGDGAYPLSAPVIASGAVFGTTAGNLGATVYKYTQSGAFNTIYQFDITTEITAPLIQGSDGLLYGTAYTGGTSNCGSVFSLTTAGKLVTTYSFPCGAGGSSPYGPLFQASDGSFYGTTEQGGASGNGTVFKMTQAGQVSILYSFKGGSDGATPDAGLVQATDGMLYGAAIFGGASNFGTLYQISTAGIYKSIYTFTGAKGQYPAALIQHTNGKLYGTANEGGANGLGAVYSLDVGLKPFLTFVLPTAKIGGTAQMLGQGFTGATSVTFNGVPATTFKVVAGTYLTATVPTGATTGPVVVTTPTQTLTSNVNFRVTK